jgi:ureidoglycolate lyase
VNPILLQAIALTAEAFRPFGDVIEIEGHRWLSINEGTCQRFDDLAHLDVLEAGGRPLISVFRAAPRPLPLRVHGLERHPLSSQAFYPLERRPFLVVVAEEGKRPAGVRTRAFLSSGRQGVNFRRNTWHHSLIALGTTSEFLVIDRGGAGENCEEAGVDTEVLVTAGDWEHAQTAVPVP